MNSFTKKIASELSKIVELITAEDAVTEKFFNTMKGKGFYRIRAIVDVIQMIMDSLLKKSSVFVYFPQEDKILKEFSMNIHSLITRVAAVADTSESAVKVLARAGMVRVALKIKREDYDVLKDTIHKTVNSFGKSKLEEHFKQISEDPRVKNPTMRMRWDVLHASKLKIGDGRGAPGDLNLYAYMNDDHIDAALKKVFKEIGLKEYSE